jgi:hypothetical protein
VVRHEEVVIAILGAAAGLAGLALVGFAVLAAAVREPYGPSNKVLQLIRRPGVGLVIDFVVGMCAVGVATWWLTSPHEGSLLYTVTIVLFFVQIVGLVIVMIWAIRTLLARVI